MPPSTLNAPQPAASDASLDAACRSTALLAGAFCALVFLVMLYGQVTQPMRDPWKSPQLLELKAKLVTAPKAETLKQQIRDLDLHLRQRYSAHLASTKRGGWMLVAGAVVFLAAARKAAALRKKLPTPTPNPAAADQATRAAQLSRWAVAGTGAVAVLALLSLTLTTGSALPRNAAELARLTGEGPDSEAVPDFAPLDEMKANWPRFRGWDGGGVTLQTNLVLTWGTNSGAGLIWKTPVPAIGFNSPIVWRDRIFLSGGDEKKREVLCFDAKTGALAWQKTVENVSGSPAKQPEIPEGTGFAAPTMATDGRRVYAIFANGDLAALTLDGAPAWSKNLGVPKNPYGHATSLATWQGKLIVQFDQGEGEPAGSKLYAFDGASGRVAWQTSRAVHASWASPIVVEAAGKPQIIALAVPWAISYSATDGGEIWRAELLEGEVTPSPVFAGGTFLVVAPSVKLVALKPDGAGDVTKTHVLWSGEDSIPDVTSPVSNGELAFVVTTSGILTCYDAKVGKKLWEHELEMDFHASPSLAGDRLLLVSKKGVAIVVAAAREFKELARSAELGEEVHASPAFAPGRMFIRGVKHLFCIGGEAKALAQKP